MTDQPAPEGTGTPDPDMPAMETPPEPAMEAAAAPPPMPPPAPMTAPPPIAPPPAVAWQAPPPPVPMKGQRTPLALVAGILLLLLAIGGGLLGLLIIVVGSTIINSLGSDITNIPGYNGDPAALFTGVFAFFGIIIIAYSVAYLLAGIGVIRNSNWARVLGIVVGIISGLIWLGGLTGAGNAGTTGAGAAATAGGGLFSIVLFAIHAYIVVVLLFFWRSKPSA